MRKRINLVTNNASINFLILGFASGIPLLLSSSTLQAWYSTHQVDLTTIGLLALVGQPYVLRFLWAPIFDKYTFFNQPKRAGWVMFFQTALSFVLFFMSCFSPTASPGWLAILAMLLAFFSACQDVVIDAHRAENVNHQSRGKMVAISVLGYRSGMMISGGLLLLFADKWGFAWSYRMMAVVMLMLAIYTYFYVREKTVFEKQVQHKGNFLKSFVGAYRSLLQISDIYKILVFIILYKLGDVLTMSMSVPFLLTEGQFSLTDVGFSNKTMGLCGMLLGLWLAGMMMPKLGPLKSLLYFGLLQSLSNLLYLLILFYPGHVYLMMAVMGIEYFCTGMATCALIAMMMRLCVKPEHSAVHYALISAIGAVPRVFFASLSGWMIQRFGWSAFFISGCVVSLPAFLLLQQFKDHVCLSQE